MKLAPSIIQGRLPGLEGATGWLNSPPLAPVLLDETELDYRQLLDGSR